jgi:hypothetical protein
MRFSRAVTFLILSLGLQCVQASGQQVVATWTDATGNWSNPANWSTLTVPNNGGGRTYSAVITAPGSVVTMDVLNDTIDNLSLASGNQLNINSGNTMNLVSGQSVAFGSSINSHGTLNNASGSDLFAGLLGNLGVLNNYGVITSYGLTNTGTLNNHGFIGAYSIPSFDISITNVTGAIFNNYGSVEFNLTRIVNYGALTNSGLMTEIDNGSLTNAGTITNVSGASMKFGIGGGGIVNLSGANVLNAGSITFDDAGMQNAGKLINSGTITTTNLFGGGFANSGTIINSGTIDSFNPFDGFANSGAIINSGAINNFGTSGNGGPDGRFLNSGTIINSGTITNDGIFSNSGAVLIANSGLVTTSTNYTQTSGSTIVDGKLTATGNALVNIQGGTLGGTGTINGNVLMAGTMRPGDAPGTLTIFGNYEQTGTGIFKELMSPYAQAFLDVSGNVVLDPGALLEITLLRGFNPLGDTISIMDFSTLSGQFANGSSFLDDGFLWDITYRQHEIDVTAVEAVPEPSSMLLLSLGLIALGTIAKRKKWQNS